MAGISQATPPEDVLVMFARNASLYGYQGDRPTEFLLLVDRYVRQARELQQLADANGTIRVAGCDDAARLIQVLGYKFQRTCRAGDASLMTANPERAFLTIDSGFPLTALERALSTNQPFVYSFPFTRVPILFKEKNWAEATVWNKPTGGGNLLDELLHDQNLDRLYTALANCDEETRAALLRSPGLRRLASVAPILDLYGREISIRAGAVVVPGGAEKQWEQLAGVSPRSPGTFVMRLLSKDKGWLATYFDVLSRLDRTQQTHFTDEVRLRRLYNAYRSTAWPTKAGLGVYPRNADLLVLLTSLKWESNGDLKVPGTIAVWRQILSERGKSDGLRSSVRRAHCCDNTEGLLDTLVAASNVDVDDGLTQIFLMLAAMNAERPPERALSEATARLVAAKFSGLKDWFPIFVEFPALDDTSIAQFVSAANAIEGVSNPTLRSNALGAFQAETGLWRIFARQGQIPAGQLNSSWQNVIHPYLGIGTPVQLFEAARNSLQSLLQVAAGATNLSQDQIIDLLAGPIQQNQLGQRVHRELAVRIRAVLDDQRLASLDSLFGLYDGLTEMAHGAQIGASLLPLAENLKEFEMPRPIFTGSEKSSWAPVVYTNRHAELQVRTDLTKIIRSPASPAQLESARAQLTPFLRDTLVGLNYAYYEPPGAEVLHNNPLFIRSHDFSSNSVEGLKRIWGAPQLFGVGATAGGGAFLMGSLADLPYALALTEEDFIVPRNVQALIWKEVVPDLLVASILPRWWNVSQNELHAAALYQRSGEEILIAAGTNPELRQRVMQILSDRMTPNQMDRVEHALEDPQGARALASQVLPSDSFYLAAELRRTDPQHASKWGQSAKELDELFRKSPAAVSPAQIIADFGVPHPTLLLSDSCTLVNMRPVVAFGGNNSRLLAESWESNNLYWARLADEMGYSPVALNILVPALTRRMVSNIFASNSDDWGALLRAMRQTGTEFRRGEIVLDAADTMGPARHNQGGSDVHPIGFAN